MSELPEIDRLRLENEALHRVVQRFANIPLDVEHDVGVIIRTIQKARNILADVKRRQKPPRTEDPVEQACFYIVNAAKGRGVIDPFIVLERQSRRSWTAVIADYEINFGIGEGLTALEATQRLLGKVKAVPGPALTPPTRPRAPQPTRSP